MAKRAGKNWVPDPSHPLHGQVLQVWEAYRQANPGTKAELKGVAGQRRYMATRDRLEQGFTVNDLCVAVLGLARSEWHQQNGHADLWNVMRDERHVEMFTAVARKPATGQRGGEKATGEADASLADSRMKEA